MNHPRIAPCKRCTSLTGKSLLALILLVSASTALAIDPIHTLVAVSPKALLGGTTAAEAADRIEGAMDFTLSNTGFAHQREVKADPHLVPSTYVGDAVSGSGLIAGIFYMQSKLDGPLATVRDTIVPFGADGYDIVALVVDANREECGVATFPPDFEDVEGNAEESAFVVFNASDTCFVEFGTYIIAHEFGHLLGGEHQEVGWGGIDNDTDGENPVPYNHPVYQFYAHTLMGSPGTYDNPDRIYYQYSRFPTGQTLGNTNVPEGELDKNMFQLISLTTWDMVADYRPRPTLPPQEGEARLFFFYNCVGPYETAPSVSFFTPGVHFSVRIRIGGSGNWGACALFPIDTRE